MLHDAWVPFDGAVVLALMMVGAWLESINGKHGFLDELLAPFPFGLAGIVMLCLERVWA